MERGTERERTAVRERWAVIERKRASGTRLLRGLSLVGVGSILLLLAVASEVCFTTARGGVIDCTPMARPPVGVVFALFGAIALGRGLWDCWAAVRR